MSLPSDLVRTSRAALVFLVLLASLGASTPLHAQQAQAADDEAYALFEAGRVAFEQGRFDDAYERFVQAHALSHRSGLLYNIATAADRGDQTTEAIDAYARYLAEEPEAENRAFVEARLAVLRARPVVPPAGSEGPEVVRETVSTTQVEEPEVALDTSVTPASSQADPTASIVLFTLAGLTGATAIVTGVMGWTARSELELHCPMRACPDNTLAGRAEEMTTLALATDLLAGSSLALAAAGLVTFLVMPSSTEQRALSLAVTPTGMSLRGSF